MARSVQYDEAQAERVWPRAPIEKVLGTKEDKRSTKAWIPTFEQAANLSLLDEFGGQDGAFLKVLRRLEEKEFQAKGIPQDQWEEHYRFWSGPDRFRRAHQSILEHSVSVDGKSLKISVRHESLRENVGNQAKESGENGTG